jgi:hypothetical protein
MNHVAFMSSLSNINQYRYVNVRTGLAHMGSQDRIFVKPKYFFLSCSRLIVILHYTKNYYTEVLYFPEIKTIHHCKALLQVALVSIPPHKFVRPPCWYYRL